MPRAYHPFADLLSDADVVELVSNVETVIGKCVDVMPTHEAFIAQHCAAAPAMAKPA
jgi:tryptophan halogenase